MPPIRATADVALADVLGRALVRGEVSIARTRLFIVAIACVEELIFLAMHPVTGRTLLGWVPLVSLALGGVLTAVGLKQLRRAGARPRARSAALDAALILGVALPVALAPDATYTGAFHHPPSVFFLLAIAASGLRLSRPLVRVASVANAACMLLLLAVDLAVGSLPPRVDEWILWTMAFFGVAFLADGMALRARRLAQDTAGAVLSGERARQALGVYVSEEVAAAALAAGDVVPGGQRQAVAVLFADLRGFTAYSAQVPPERLVAELNAWLGVMVGVVRDNGGVVDKYIGDALMVVFGMSSSMPDAASRALYTAVEMQRALVLHNVDRAERGVPPFAMTIGVHYGEAVVGNIGTAERMQYTVVGDAVNLASRLQRLARERDLLVAASAGLVDVAGRRDGVPTFDSLGPVRIVERPDDVVVFGLRGLV